MSMETTDYSYFIERYIGNEMTEDELHWFEKELEGNEKLRDEFTLRKHTDNILDNQDIISLRNKLTEIEQRRESEILINNSTRNIYLKYAAVIAAFILIGGSITMLTPKTRSNDEIISRYYKVYEPSTTQRSGQSVTNSDFAIALEFYKIQDYEKAVISFKKVLQINPRDMQSELLNGVSNFELRKYLEAKKSFSKIIEDNNNLFVETAKWYLAVYYIKTDEKDNAVHQLDLIKSEGGIYSNDAKKILRMLK
jgi:tetratricopeptide (TPR) repeat protein